jgi:hypothetical protein
MGAPSRLAGQITFRVFDFEVYPGPRLEGGGLAGRAPGDPSAFDDLIGELVKQRGDDRVDLSLGGNERFATSLTGIPANPAQLGFLHATDFLQEPAARDFCASFLPHLVPKRALFNSDSFHGV